MQLMDLPYDVLETIYMHLMGISWSGVDFALVNRTTMRLLHENRWGICHYLYRRPWWIYEGTMRAIAGELFVSGWDALHHGVKYQQMGWIKRLEITCITGGHYHEDGMEDGDWRHTTDEEIELLLGDWPVNKVVLIY